MQKILVVDDAAICREPIVASLRHEGYDAHGAAGGAEAVEILRAGPPDLLLLDLAMPQMDGWAVLHAIRDIQSCRSLPVILLTSTVDAQCVVRARELGVREYLLKTRFSLPEMLLRIRRQLGAHDAPARQSPPRAAGRTEPARARSSTANTAPPGALPPATPPGAAGEPAPAGAARGAPAPIIRTSPLTRDEMLQRLEQCTQAKTLAGVVAEVVTLAGSPRGSVSDLVAVLKRDPVLSSRVLQAANSAAFATAKPHVGTVEEAVRNIGLSAVRNMAASVGIFESFSAGAADGIDLVRCWQHCFAVAALMERLVPPSDAAAGGAHLVGLCHDLGEMVLRQHFPKQFAVAVELVKSGRTLREVHAEVFGLQPAESAELILSKLGLPKSVVEPIQEFFEHSESAVTARLSPFARSLRIADQYAHGLLLASSPDAPVGPVAQAEYRKVVGETGPTIDGPGLRGEVIGTVVMMTRLSAREQESLFEPMFPFSGAKIWYARHGSLAEFDPLAAALGCLAQPQMYDRLPPGPEELADCQALVVAVPRAGLAPLALADVQRLIAGRPDFPVLYLVAKGQAAAAAAPGIRVAEYPVPLSALHEFVSGLSPL